MRRQMIQNLVVGIFTAAVLAYGMYFVYQTSEESTILLNKITLYTIMPNAMGLKRYAPVKVHGISVGKIERIWFSETPGEDKVYLEMSMSADYINRVAISNPDPEAPANQAEPDGMVIYSYISVESEGLLGDNLVQIYAGDPERAKAGASKRIRTAAVRMVKEEWEKQEKTWDEAAAGPEIQAKVKLLSKDLIGLDTGHVEEGSWISVKKGGAGLAGITDSIDPLVSSLTSLLDEAKTQPGLIHALIYDPEIPDKLKGVLGDVQGVLDEVDHGTGNLHTLIYGDDVKKALNDVSQVTGSVQAIMDDLEKKKVVDNIKGTLANVEDITAMIKEGKGTVGALITDKSLYEDIQAILGSASRSAVVKEAVRYTKERGEKQIEKEKKKEEKQQQKQQPSPP
ncbi:MAG: hypothetical protein A2V67_10685 [Deltaproteobacteria bacterium RBG_13_61_14]|nr:MAG: hypothetical protein A2V67_10685 [Deltaproteobacteria bacterium RBG_13_61_14]